MKIRYLVADDTAFIRELVKAVLKNEGHLCVGEAADGPESIELATQTLPDLVLLDLVMPRMNGVTAAKFIREVWPEVKIVALTTLEQGDLSEEDHKLFDAWIEKPFEKAHVTSVIEKLFAQQISREAKNE